MIHTNEDIEKRIKRLEKLVYSLYKERPTCDALIYDHFVELEGELRCLGVDGTKEKEWTKSGDKIEAEKEESLINMRENI